MQEINLDNLIDEAEGIFAAAKEPSPQIIRLEEIFKLFKEYIQSSEQ